MASEFLGSQTAVTPFQLRVIGGAEVGLSYVVPVAVLLKWFPDRRGLITGVAVGGFGAGALVTAPLATWLIQQVGVLETFAYLGDAYLILTVISGYFMPTRRLTGDQKSGCPRRRGLHNVA